MKFRTLISTEELSHLMPGPDPQVVIVDCRFKLDDTGWGAREYAAAHIPGAVYADLDHDLAGEKTGTNGRHPLPSPSAFTETLGRLGIGDDTQVVAYDQDAGSFASRLWWMLRWMGHDAAAVLDGGWAKWIQEGRPTASGEETRPRAVFHGSPRAEAVAGIDDVSRAIENPQWSLVDARAPERYRGEVEPIDRVAGHIATAINHPFKTNLGADGTFLPVDALRQRLQSTLGDTPPDRVICYCGSGVTACHNLLALEHAGLPGAKLYPGSWSEWSSGVRPRSDPKLDPKHNR